MVSARCATLSTPRRNSRNPSNPAWLRGTDSRPLVCSPYQGYRLLLIGSCPGRRMNPHTCSTPRHYAAAWKGPTTTGGVGRELDLAGQVDASSPRRGRMSDRGYPPKSPTSRHVVIPPATRAREGFLGWG